MLVVPRVGVGVVASGEDAGGVVDGEGEQVLIFGPLQEAPDDDGAMEGEVVDLEDVQGVRAEPLLVAVQLGDAEAVQASLLLVVVLEHYYKTMDLNFAVFPAPRCTYTSTSPDSPIIWVPKYRSLYPCFQGFQPLPEPAIEQLHASSQPFYSQKDDDDVPRLDMDEMCDMYQGPPTYILEKIRDPSIPQDG